MPVPRISRDSRFISASTKLDGPPVGSSRMTNQSTFRLMLNSAKIQKSSFKLLSFSRSSSSTLLRSPT
jgi:hypothetical protein